MAIDSTQKRRAAFNHGAVVWLVLPVSTGTINDEDRAMVKGLYYPGAFPVPTTGTAAGNKTGIAIAFSPNI